MKSKSKVGYLAVHNILLHVQIKLVSASLDHQAGSSTGGVKADVTSENG